MAYDKTNKAAQRVSRIVRWSILGVVLAGITVITGLHQAGWAGKRTVPVDALCPFGGLETLFTLVSGAGFIQKIAVSSVILLVGAVALALVFRRSFCGQVCPLGAMQGIFGTVGRKLFRRRPQLPAALDGSARWLKYVILAFFIAWTWTAGELVIRPYDPWAAWAHITSAELWTGFGVGAAVLLISLIASVVYERFFCKYLCPMGAFLGIFSKMSFLRVRRDANACIDCGRCDKACPMNVNVSASETVTTSECISCAECVNVCPAQGALEVAVGVGGRTVTPLAATGIVVGTLALAIALSTIAGAFSWTMPTLGEAVRQTGQGSAAFDPELIKGYMSMEEVASVTGISEDAFRATFGVPEADFGRPMKEITEQYGFSTEDVRAWVGQQMSVR